MYIYTLVTWLPSHMSLSHMSAYLWLPVGNTDLVTCCSLETTQGSPLSPILFLFFNSDLVQCTINRNGGSIAFVDDYTA
jgi:hypothetical protein